MKAERPRDIGQIRDDEALLVAAGPRRHRLPHVWRAHNAAKRAAKGLSDKERDFDCVVGITNVGGVVANCLEEAAAGGEGALGEGRGRGGGERRGGTRLALVGGKESTTRSGSILLISSLRFGGERSAAGESRLGLRQRAAGPQQHIRRVALPTLKGADETLQITAGRRVAAA